MPEGITISDPQTPALSPENEEMLKAMAGEGESSSSELLAGKYKSVEELEKGYKELQSKLGQRTEATGDESPQGDEGDQDEEPDQQAPESSGDAKEIYGEFIGSRLEEAGIDFGDMNTRWQQSGELTGEDYTQLEEAGFNKAMVDAYLAGLQYKATQDSDLSTQQIAAIKSEYGGDQGYSQMLEWAASNLSQEEIDGFNQIVNTSGNMATIKLAVAGLHAMYSQQAGREPKLIGGRTAKTSNDRFESTAQLVEAMKDSRYTNDSAYRRKIQEKLSRSSIF